MAGASGQVRELMDDATAARAQGDFTQARAAFVRAFELARADHDIDAMAESALGLTATLSFGPNVGRVPAFLHEVYTQAEGRLRTQLAVALARAWAYGLDSHRAVPFAEEAVAGAEASGDPALLADALDAQLLVHWGPDDFEERLRITCRLEDVVAHVADVEARMFAYIWRMTSAMENLDLSALRRQLRALEQLADESGSARVRFFAAARQGMYALLLGEPDRAEACRVAAVAAGTEAGEADTFAIDHSLRGAIAQQRRDIDMLRTEAEAYEVYATSESVVSVGAQSVELWLDAGEPERARALLDQIAGGGLAVLARDVDWLLSVSLLTLAAARLGVAELAAEGHDLLVPYAGRGVANAGAVTLPGVVDDYLREACVALGRAEEAERWRRSAVASYQRMGAMYLLRRIEHVPTSEPVADSLTGHLRPTAPGVWQVGLGAGASAMREMKGFSYLRTLLQRPGVDVSALTLSGAGVEDVAVDEVIDRQALAAYRDRLVEIDEELDEAGARSDDGRVARLQDERDALLEEVGRATGLGGRVRRTSSTGERARVAVRKAVAAAIERIEEQDPRLGRLLRDCIETGTACRYNPDPARPVEWVLD